ncbi:FHA domain-containing protein [uncultured Mycobacterium sp.]|uniref:FHA domain-containing protein n=1 Tax=uncultured Mycobacterium sp. TaxID=171292 RepID=A0A1Y5PH87_9MYCO|nr:FHA domain-containing protein [uncultured Mycobacterium sp.]
MKVGRKPAGPGDRGGAKAAVKKGRKEDPKKASKAKAGTAAPRRRGADTPARSGRATARRPHEPRGLRQGPQTAPVARPAERPARAKNVSQAKARAKARKAKAPRIVRPPLRERLIARLVTIDLRPQTLMAKVPFVVLVIGALGVGLAVTLWLSTAAAQRSYQLGAARSTNEALSQQKEALERDVLEAESAPALAESARNLGMIPSKDTAHLVQDPTGNWTVVGKPKPAEGAPPPPLNNKLPDAVPQPPAAPAPPAAAAPKPGSSPEVPVRVVPAPLGGLPFNGAVTLPPGALTVPPGTVLPPGALTLPGVAPLPNALATAPIPTPPAGVLAVPAQAPAVVLPPAPADAAPPALTPDVAPAAPAAPVAPAGIGQ